jgi:hypothetical protein
MSNTKKAPKIGNEKGRREHATYKELDRVDETELRTPFGESGSGGPKEWWKEAKPTRMHEMNGNELVEQNVASKPDWQTRQAAFSRGRASPIDANRPYEMDRMGSTDGERNIEETNETTAAMANSQMSKCQNKRTWEKEKAGNAEMRVEMNNDRHHCKTAIHSSRTNQRRILKS